METDELVLQTRNSASDKLESESNVEFLNEVKSCITKCKLECELVELPTK